MNTKKIVFICNPAAGKGEAVSHYETFKSSLSPDIVCRCFKKRITGNGCVQEALQDGFNTFIIAGGDGTVHEFINEVFPYTGKIVVGIIPVGTGNDLARSLMDYRTFLKKPRFYVSRLADSLGKGHLKSRKGAVYSFNNVVFWTCYLGIGFDGQVISYFHRYRNSCLPNRFVYLLAVLKTLAYRIRVPVKFLPERGINTVYGQKRRDLFQLLLLNIPSYCGGVIQGVHKENEIGFHLICIKSAREFLSLFIKNSLPVSFKNTFFSSGPTELGKKDLVFEISSEAPVQIDGEDYSKQFGAGGVNHVKKAGEITLILQKF